MTKEYIKNFISNLESKSYRSPAIYLGGGPDWLDDIRELIKCIKFLLESKAND